MKQFAAVMLLALWFAACAPPVAAPQPTYTPLPTYTPYPTYTPGAAQPTSRAPVPPVATQPAAAATLSRSVGTSAAKCIAWTEAAAHLGETACVRGKVYSTFKSGSAFFIDFDGTSASFYGVSFTNTFDGLSGKCVEISGKISPYRGRPQIVIESKEQLGECAN